MAFLRRPIETNISIALGIFVISRPPSFRASVNRFMRTETDNARQREEQTRSTPAASDGREINRYTCRTKNAVNPTPSTKLPKLIDTLSRVSRKEVRGAQKTRRAISPDRPGFRNRRQCCCRKSGHLRYDFRRSNFDVA